MNTGMFESSPGNTSSARVMFVIGLVYAMVISAVGLLLLKWTSGEFIAVFAATSGVFIGLKLGQKPMEKTPPNVTEG